MEQKVGALWEGIEKEEPRQPERKGRYGVGAVKGPSVGDRDKGKDEDVNGKSISCIEKLHPSLFGVWFCPFGDVEEDAIVNTHCADRERGDKE